MWGGNVPWPCGVGIRSTTCGHSSGLKFLQLTRWCVCVASVLLAAYASEAIACCVLASNLMLCSRTADAGRRLYSVAEVQGLLRRAERALALAKRALSPPFYEQAQEELPALWGVLAARAAAFPGQALLPVERGNVETAVDTTPAVSVPRCSGCGNNAAHLRKCAACKVAAYCSRACQVKHWKEGGHRRECAQLASGSAS